MARKGLKDMTITRKRAGSYRLRRSRFGAVLGMIAAVALVLAGCSVDNSGDDSKPTIRLAYQSFPSGDLIVKNNGWLE